MGSGKTFEFFRDRSYDTIKDFVDDVHNYLSVKDTVLALGDVREDEFKHSKICCPFHNEKTPSLHIHEDFFRCYGCGVKGDIFKWIELSNDISFMEAVHKMADFLGCSIASTNYVSRKPMQEAIAKEWEQYKEDLRRCSTEKTERAAAVIKEARDFFPLEVGYDSKSHYLVFPFTNKHGKVLGFTKRRLDNTKKTPKWIHSTLSDSLIGECHNIFNLGRAWETIKNNHEVIFVEGPRDVKGMITADYPNTVAISGTSNFSEDIMGVFAPIKELTFMYDGDDAGRKGMIANIMTILKASPMLLFNTYISVLPESLDPGNAGKEVIKNSMEHRIRSIEWFVSNAKLDTQKEFYKEALKSPNILPIFMSAFNKKNCSTTNQSVEILKHDTKQNIKGGDNVVDYKTQLMVTAGLIFDESVQLLPISPEEATKILELRYKIKPKQTQ